MKSTCEFCGVDFRKRRLYHIPARLTVRYDCEVNENPLTCHSCGQAQNIFCIYGHNCYMVWMDNEQKYCPMCFNEYLEIAEHSDVIAKQISKEFLALMREKHGRSEEIRYRVNVRISGERLFWRSASNCAFSAALGDETCRQIILRFSYVIPPKTIRVLTTKESNFSRN